VKNRVDTTLHAWKAISEARVAFLRCTREPDDTLLYCVIEAILVVLIWLDLTFSASE
jgi:hypothetical protein